MFRDVEPKFLELKHNVTDVDQSVHAHRNMIQQDTFVLNAKMVLLLTHLTTKDVSDVNVVLRLFLDQEGAVTIAFQNQSVDVLRDMTLDPIHARNATKDKIQD